MTWKFNFTGAMKNIPLKSLPSRYIDADKRGYISVWADDEEYISAFAPHLNLPVCMIGNDTRFTSDNRSNEEWGIVIPKGTICSTQIIAHSGVVPGAYISISGVFDNSTMASYFGLTDGINSTTVICNGGTATDYPYTALDVEVGTLKNMAGDLATALDNWHTAINKPVGIAIDDQYQTVLPGRYQNYSHKDEVSLMVKGSVKVPYYNGDLTSYLTTANYQSVSRKHAFSYNPNGCNVEGSLVKSDIWGKYVIDDSVTLLQKIGRSIELELTTPFAYNEKVSNMYDSAATSDKTYGYKSHLFYFAQDVLTAKAVQDGNDAPTAAEVAAAILAGTFAFAIINIDCR